MFEYIYRTICLRLALLFDDWEKILLLFYVSRLTQKCALLAITGCEYCVNAARELRRDSGAWAGNKKCAKCERQRRKRDIDKDERSKAAQNNKWPNYGYHKHNKCSRSLLIQEGELFSFRRYAERRSTSVVIIIIILTTYISIVHLFRLIFRARLFFTRCAMCLKRPT